MTVIQCDRFQKEVQSEAGKVGGCDQIILASFLEDLLVGLMCME